MKRNHNILIAVLTGLAIVFTISACQKSFDPKSYAPKKPAPTFGGYSSSSQIEADSLVAYWNFSNTLTDSISKLTGTATNSSFAAGIFGPAYQGSLTGYAVCKSSPALAALQKFTASVWVNTTPPTTGLLDYFTLSNTVNFWGNVEMFFDNGSTNTDAHVRIHLSQSGTDNTFAAEVPGCFNGWVNLIFSYDVTGACTLYMNGKSVATGKAGTLTGPLVFQNVGNVVFGCTQFTTVPSQTAGSGAQPWAANLPGKIDQVRVYNKVLSANEASALYNLENLGR
ncbi:Concanavalin A-like lectin/glucanases superfamily protein [Mucilaginibacter mallensis]|uniref:Concanavalin A-like lectin/glucanases superfamily protein n=1 Tax=Mucilaginibacter mallensis TaxID=652787 RepID=A0A1H2BKS5_MUCMA|nr:LamG-like jellyroll fold domain-containing protein [Mucilaginibacter mallensis]SDT58677.1 Concanavalin A-like lectin/glucanases superfamily protein [Mucilaginibacter mallensis]